MADLGEQAQVDIQPEADEPPDYHPGVRDGDSESRQEGQTLGVFNPPVGVKHVIPFADGPKEEKGQHDDTQEVDDRLELPFHYEVAEAQKGQHAVDQIGRGRTAAVVSAFPSTLIFIIALELISPFGTGDSLLTLYMLNWKCG